MNLSAVKPLRFAALAVQTEVGGGFSRHISRALRIVPLALCIGALPDLVAAASEKVPARMAKYMVVDLSKGTSATAADPYPITFMDECPNPKRRDGGWTDEYKTTKMVFRLVEPGTGKLGWLTNAFTDWNCTPVVTVTFARPYYLAVFELTQGQARRITGDWFGDQRREFTGGRRELRPVSNASWNSLRGSASKGCCWPNDGTHVDPSSLIGIFRERTGCEFFDLPTECEWEYAARAGATDAWGGDGLAPRQGCTTGISSASSTTNTTLHVRGRYRFNGGFVQNADGALVPPPFDCGETNGTAVVGSYKPNAWGFYDMLGNASECTLDYFSGNRVSSPEFAGGWNGSRVAADPVGAPVPEDKKRSDGIYRVVKGGRWSQTPPWCAFPTRNMDNANSSSVAAHGCRLVWRLPE